MRTVQDARRITWICLEMPSIPHDQQAAAEALGDVVAIECNTGAERVVALVRPGWDDEWSDEQLNAAIAAAQQ